MLQAVASNPFSSDVRGLICIIHNDVSDLIAFFSIQLWPSRRSVSLFSSCWSYRWIHLIIEFYRYWETFYLFLYSFWNVIFRRNPLIFYYNENVPKFSKANICNQNFLFALDSWIKFCFCNILTILSRHHKGLFRNECECTFITRGEK